MLVVLRMNRSYMAFMREHYPEVAGQQFHMTLVSTAENSEQGDFDDTAWLFDCIAMRIQPIW